MNKNIIFAIVAILLVLGSVVLIQNVNLNRIGTDKYYTQITKDGEKFDEAVEGGGSYERYAYELRAYDKSGEARDLEFTSGKNLRKEAYLILYFKDDRVKSYEEVRFENLPKKVQELILDKQ